MTPREQATALIAWYAEHCGERRLPWRERGEPVHRVALTEGLLAQTRADAVAAEYGRIFAGVETVEDWLEIASGERLRRVAPLGLPRHKQAAMDSIALALTDALIDPHLSLAAASLELRHGIGPYMAGMVALLFGNEGAPVDCNVQRVGARCAGDGDAARWMAEVMGEAVEQPHGTWIAAPGYEACCAVLDIGATICRIDCRECSRCPLQRGCASAARGGDQLLFPWR